MKRGDGNYVDADDRGQGGRSGWYVCVCVCLHTCKQAYIYEWISVCLRTLVLLLALQSPSNSVPKPDFRKFVQNTSMIGRDDVESDHHASPR